MMSRIGAVVVAAFLAGCSHEMGREIDQIALRQLEPGETTYDDALARLGEPTQETVNADGSRIVVYSHVEASAFGSARSDRATLKFDEAGTLRDITRSSGEY